ncbi:hypothetical protein OLMES_5359 [Oleiphilus messinensis]|uniref:DUF4401 domain-containing protein n=1 Tax=Oleiphilus messinensis TaxID=141451 RepID=A0A1Y0IGS9_9GAMM|nr:DUF4401 domain-containing protein [Oleiphilus messinensis]ARU59339.1 hypothetical protein OLMES_5359 [Oleiphilus messinensis]
MTHSISLQELLAKTSGHSLHEAEAALQAIPIEKLETPQPWYVRTLIGFGAWMSSWMLMSFILGINLLVESEAYGVWGILFMILALVQAYRVRSLFFNQFGLSLSLTGQLLFAIGVAEQSQFGDITAPLITLILTNAILLLIYPDRVHRFLSIVFINAALLPLVYKWQLNALIPFFAPILVLIFGAFIHFQPRILAQGKTEWFAPIAAGALVSAMAWVLLSALYVLPELLDDFQFYPNPWITTVAISVLFGIALMERVRTTIDPFPPVIAGLLGALLSVLTLLTLNAPGILLSLLVLWLGKHQGSRFYQGLGITFLCLFIAAFFYGIGTTLWMKSIILCTSGFALLLAQQLLSHLQKQQLHSQLQENQ